MKKIINAIRKEDGMTLMETVVILALVGAIFVVVAPSIRQMFVGTNENSGLATQAVESQLIGFDEANKGAIGAGGVRVVEGCRSDVYTQITNEECNELNN